MRLLVSGLRGGFSAALVALSLAWPSMAADLNWTNGISVIGELKYPPGFKHFDYVNPTAPKGGDLRLTELATFDNLNPVINKGNIVLGIGLVYETLMKSSLDESFSSYGLIAESIAYPADFSSVSFKLNPNAKWADGQPVTVDDVLFSFEKAKEYDQSKLFYYQHVKAGKKTGDREVTFEFDLKGNRELPAIMGQLIVVPKHWWESTGPNGKKRDISATSLELPMGSGTYKIKSMKPGSSITYELRDDYWGKDLNVNIGYDNFRTINYTFFSDINVEFEAFRGGSSDYWSENEAKRWKTAYDFPAVRDGRIKKEELENDYRNSGVLVGFIPNLRREMFKDQRVREALNYAFDFEELNRTIFYMQYSRINSYYYGSELASSGLPQGKELEILNEVKDLIPADVFTEEYKNPVGGEPKKFRDNLRKAVALLKEAGYEIRGRDMVNVKTGKPLAFEIMLNTPVIERIALPYAQNLQKIGIKATVRSVDSSQFVERSRKRDFDVLYTGWAQSLNPGNEQAEYWGSKSAATDGTQNYAGISDPGIDKLIQRVIFSKDRDEHVAATKALDRVLLHHHYVVPSYTLRYARLAYWDKFDRPKPLPKYSSGFPSIWWAKQ
ncbi:ABC transporter substrate-binding protein [Rhizobium sp. TH2]|uniref:extracellular solute-binding protein n=1 Tax=Rhizobium sp. TH2 TaxID=2775403 RepID=UPI002202CBC6|nr:ABC transporter substrate-binding protein [Rhizobium sp. TH2]